jgi:hypothetical protein
LKEREPENSKKSSFEKGALSMRCRIWLGGHIRRVLPDSLTKSIINQ